MRKHKWTLHLGVAVVAFLAVAHAQSGRMTSPKATGTSLRGGTLAGSSEQLRSRDHNVETYVLRPVDGRTDELLSLVREHWSMIRAKNLAAATPILILLDDTHPEKPAIQYSFRWRERASRDKAKADPEVSRLFKRIQSKSETVFSSTASNQAFQGFDYAKFPDTGGVELLGGRCDSEIKLDGVSEPVRISVANGFVLMHRSPGHINQ